MGKKYYIFAALLSLAMLAAGQARAAGSGTPVPGVADSQSVVNELKYLASEVPMVESATKTAIPINKAPASVTVIDYKHIKRSGARTLPELLRLVPGVNVRWTPMMQQIDIRGFGSLPFTNRVLLLIDGVPYNSWNKGGFPQQPGVDFFTMENVRRIEVVKGPGSVLYGENAYWGVINILSLSGEDIAGKSGGGKVSFMGGSLHTRKLNGQYGTTFDRGSFLLSATDGQTQMPLQFWTLDNSSITKGTDVFTKLKFDDATLTYYRHQDDMSGFGQNGPTTAFHSVPHIKQTVDIGALKYNRDISEGRFTVGADMSFARRNGMHCGACHANTTNIGALVPASHLTQPDDHGYQLVGDFRFGVHNLPHNDLLFGVDVRRYAAKNASQEFMTPTATQPVVTGYNKPAFYVQDLISLLDDKLTVVGGVRYDGRTAPSLFKSNVSPRIAFVYNPTTRLNMRVGWSKAYRTPSFDELYMNTLFFNMKAGPVTIAAPFTPNPNLKPESISTYDAGVEYTFSRRWSLKLDGYYSDLSNFIVMTSTRSFENHPAKAHVMGGETELKWEVSPRLTGFINYAWQTQWQTGSGVDSTGRGIDFSYAPKHKLNIGAYFRPFTGFSGALEVGARSKVTAPPFDATRGTTLVPFGAYNFVNLRLNYDVPMFIRKNGKKPLRLSFYARNLLNQKPVETQLPINSKTVGRTFFGGTEYSF